MPSTLSRVSLWDYTWGIATTLFLLGMLIAVFWKFREWYAESGSEACDWTDQLTEYRQLLENGQITQEEFQKIKKQIISRNPSLESKVQAIGIKSADHTKSENEIKTDNPVDFKEES